MINVTFVCHGNICRSTMAEMVFKDMVKKRHLADMFHINSSATSREEIGNGVHYGTRNKLAQVGIPCEDHRAVQLTKRDYQTYDYILDAIDSLDNKVLLIRRACETPATFFASMGAAMKMDPLKIDIAEFWKVKGCPLAKALRNKFKKSKQFPAKKFKCVYSEELLENKGADTFHETTAPLAENDWHAAKVHTNGTIAHTTAIFGFMLAGLVIQDIIQQTEK